MRTLQPVSIGLADNMCHGLAEFVPAGHKCSPPAVPVRSAAFNTGHRQWQLKMSGCAQKGNHGPRAQTAPCLGLLRASHPTPGQALPLVGRKGPDRKKHQHEGTSFTCRGGTFCRQQVRSSCQTPRGLTRYTAGHELPRYAVRHVTG